MRFHIIWICADDSFIATVTRCPFRCPLYTCAADSVGWIPVVKKWAWTVVVVSFCQTEPIDFHADGWIDQMLLLFLFNSHSFHEGQGQSNSYQLFWFFSEIVGQEGAGFILIRETNGRGHVGGTLGEKFGRTNKWIVKAGKKKRKE